MPTIKPELSIKSPYWISRHRYYELKHYCLQYPTWKKAYDSLDGMGGRPDDLLIFKIRHGIADPTSKTAISKSVFRSKMEPVEKAALDADEELYDYILKAVTEGLSYENLQMTMGIPCSRETYYDRYRRFFWLLNKYRD